MTIKKRPLGITILAILAAIGAIVSFYHALQFLGLFTALSLGTHAFFGLNLVGALFAGLLGVIYIWATLGLWNLRPEGWLFVVALAVISLIFAVISIIGQSTLQAMLPAIVVYGVILLYCLRPGVKDAFIPEALTAPPAPAPEPAEAPTKSGPEDTPPSIPSQEATPATETSVSEANAGAATAAKAAAVMEDDQPPTTTPDEGSDPQSPDKSSATPTPPPTPSASKNIRVDQIEGIGPTYAATLAEAGISTTEELLEAGGTPSGRAKLAKETGLSSVNLLKWINMADLIRVPGIGEEYSQLLEVIGVDTVKELRTRNPINLHKALETANDEKHLVRRAPHLNEVESWVEAAKQLDPKISY